MLDTARLFCKLRARETINCHLGYGRRVDAGNLIAVAEKTGILELRRTTRDEPDYDKLMNYRIAILINTVSNFPTSRTSSAL